MTRKWICCQLGSREHYAIPRVLQREGLLSILLTDYWAYRTSALSAWPLKGARKLAERHHPDLKAARIEDLGFSRVYFDLRAKRKKWGPWETTLRRNEWFQERLLRRLQTRYLKELRQQPPGIFFAYSYAALRLLRFFKELGWTTVLGQIDPASREEELVAAEVVRHLELAPQWRKAPPQYWHSWREEVEEADWLIVNSAWSREALLEDGVPQEKIRIVPLAFEPEIGAFRDRVYPKFFDIQRPLRVLFLGQIDLRKGVSILLEAARQMKEDPVEFWMVGPMEIELPAAFASSPRMRWVGSIPRSETSGYYQDADVFVLPTLSDGFALTQLEAQAHGLPVIASRFCGEVVEDGKNGRIIDPLNAETLVRTLREFLEAPRRLEAMARESYVSPKFSMENLGANLLALSDETAETTRAKTPTSR